MLDQAASLRRLMENNRGENISVKKAKVITITSGKGGVGKSNLVVNLAIALQQRGKKVLVFDADIGMGNDDILLGVFPKYNIYDILFKDMDISDVIVKGPLDVELLSGGTGTNIIEELSREQRNLFLSKLKGLSYYDYILIDTGAGINRNVLAFIGACDELIITTTPEPTAITDAYGILKATKHFKLKSKAKVVVNKCFTEVEGNDTYNKLKISTNKFLEMNLELLGLILDDKKLEEAVRDRIPVLIKSPGSKASKGIYDIAENILGTNDNDKNGISQFFRKLFDIFS